MTMAIKFEKVTAGMMLYDRHSYRMGNTTLRSIGEWNVKVLSVDPATRRARVSWNGNTPEVYLAREVERLSTWSMYDDDVEVTRGMWDRVTKVRRLTKKELAARAAEVKP